MFPVHFHVSAQAQCLPNPSTNPSSVAAMSDLSTVYLPPFPELAVEASGGSVGDQAGDVAADEAAASGSSGGGDPVLLEECRWSSRVRTCDVAAGSEGAVAPRGASGKKPSPAPSSRPVQRPAPGPGRTLEDCLRDWAARKVEAGVLARYCELPFLTGAPKAVMILIHSLLERCLIHISKNVSDL
jgi:hypothetical protein